MTRTPWGGTQLAALKGLKSDAAQVVGESWEVSVEPSFPSLLAASGEALGTLIAEDPLHWLGSDAALGNTSLLVKLLDTADLLSLQVHPGDDHPDLLATESGKPESWYVVAAEVGAGIYLGWKEGITESDVREAISNEGDLTSILNFVEVSEGDFFVIATGTPHAIGPGLMLVEPQRILPGRSGVTYRYWDWNRRYDQDGKQSDQGEPRRLHIEAALAVTRFDGARGEAFVTQVMRRAGPADLEKAVSFSALSDPDVKGALRFPALSVGRIAGTGQLTLPRSDAFRAVTVVAGSISMDGETAGSGRSMVLAAGGGEYVLECVGAHAIVCAAHSS
ncbi:MAG: class I mannose-6-phosphate isomerase [Acidimicrobiales bacterium]